MLSRSSLILLQTIGNFTSVLGQLLREEGLTTPSKRTVGDTNGLLDALAHSENRAEREKLWYSMQVEVPSAIEHKVRWSGVARSTL